MSSGQNINTKSVLRPQNRASDAQTLYDLVGARPSCGNESIVHWKKDLYTFCNTDSTEIKSGTYNYLLWYQVALPSRL